MVDDFYLNLVSWSTLNVVGIALGENTYLWAADTCIVPHLGDARDDTQVATLDLAPSSESSSDATSAGQVVSGALPP